MAQIPDLTAKIKVDDRDLDRARTNVKSFADGLSDAGKSAQPLSQRLQEVGNGLTDFGRKATIGLTLPIAAGFAYATNAASDLSEAVNVTGITFGESRGKIDEFVKTTADGLGQSERAAREATASFGGLLQNLGLAEEQSADWSITLTSLASDLGSAFNKEPAVAVEALGAALRGETEPLRQFNVVLDDATVKQRAVEMGLAASTAEVDKSAKAQATLALIMEQTARVQGDFSNTSDGLANQQRILKARLEDTAAQLGEQLLPIAEKVVGAVSGLLDVFSGLSDSQQTAVLAGAGIVAALGPVTTVAGHVIKAAEGIGNAFQKIGPGNLVAGGIVLGGIALLTDALMSARKQADELVDSITAEIDLTSLTSVQTGLADIQAELAEQMEEWHEYDGVKGILQGTLEVLTPLENKVLDNAEAVKGLRGAQEDLLRTATHLEENLVTLQNELGLDEEAAQRLADSVGVDLTDSFMDVIPQLRDAYGKVKDGTVQTDRLADATDELSSDVATAEEKVKAFEEALDSLLGAQLEAEEAQIRLRSKTAELSEEITKGADADETAAEFKDRLTLKTIDVVEAVRDEIDALVRNGEVSAEAAAQQAALRDRLIELQNRFPGLREQIQVYIDKLNAIPADKNTVVDAETGQAVRDLDEVNRRVLSIPQRRVVTIVAETIGNFFGGGKAHGGPVKAHVPYLVGEHGPEIVVPKLNATVFPNYSTETQHALGGVVNNYETVINAPSTDARAIAQETQLALRVLR